MDNLKWSVLVNLLHGGMAWADAKAYILLYYVSQAAAAQTDASTQMEANKTGGANVVAVGAQAPGVRTASWYMQGAPFETGLPSQAGGGVPNWLGHVGNVLTVGSTGLEFDTASAGGISAIGNFGAAPTAKGAIISGGTDLVLEPADDTHPGSISLANQKLGSGTKTAACLIATGAADSSFVTGGVALGSGFGHLGVFPIFGGVGYPIITGDGTDTYLCAADAAGVIHFRPRINIADRATLNPTNFDMTGLGTGGALKLVDAGGTTRTITISAGGAWVIT